MTSPRTRSSAALFACVLSLLITGSALAGVSIYCLDTGQSDATLIVSSSGKTLLYDGGDNGKGTSVIVPFMNSLGLGALNYVVSSHYHEDHIGGIDEVWNAKGVTDAVYDRGWSYTTATYTNYAALVASKRQTLTDLQVIDLGDGVTATVVSINGNGVDASPFSSTSSKDENDFSVALWIQAGDFDYWQAGDLSGMNYSSSGYHDIESTVGPRVGKLEVMHMDHHGARFSTNANLLNALHPNVAVLSVGSNTYGHPTQEALDRVATEGAFIYATEAGSGGTLPAAKMAVVHGHIAIVTSGHGSYTVNGTAYAMDEPDLTPVPELAAFHLLGASPNPFNPLTSIRFATARGGAVGLTIYDLAGRQVLARSYEVGPGEQAVTWTGRDGDDRVLPSGLYLYRLRTPEGAATGRMTLAK